MQIIALITMTSRENILNSLKLISVLKRSVLRNILLHMAN